MYIDIYDGFDQHDWSHKVSETYALYPKDKLCMKNVFTLSDFFNFAMECKTPYELIDKMDEKIGPNREYQMRRADMMSVYCTLYLAME